MLFTEKNLEASIKIDASVEKIWKFFDKIDSNYKLWHPESHVGCHWLKGRPHQEGSVALFEEILDGRLHKIKLKFTKIDKYRYVEYRPFFPLSLFHPKGAFVYEPIGKGSKFTAINQFRVPVIFGKKMASLIDATERHMKEEGENLKKIIETT